MNYFILQQDRRLPNTIAINDLSTIKNYKQALKGDTSNLADMSIAFVNSSKKNIYPSVFDKQITMIDSELKSVFELFIPQTSYKYCCVIDRELDNYTYYSIPILENIGFDLIQKNEYSFKQHILKTQIKERWVFIVSLLCAEVVLRKKLTGIQILKI